MSANICQLKHLFEWQDLKSEEKKKEAEASFFLFAFSMLLNP